MASDPRNEAADDGAPTTVAHLADAVDRLRERIDRQDAIIGRLVADLDAERGRRRGYERCLAELDRDHQSRPAVELRVDEGDTGCEIGDVWIGGLPVGKLAENTKDRTRDLQTSIETLAERLERVERGEVDPSELVAQSSGPELSELLPLHRHYLRATTLEPRDHDLAPNQELAGRTFPFLADQAVPRGDGELVLTSPNVRDVIERKVATPALARRLPEVESPSRETVKRVMEFVDRFGTDLFEMRRAKDTGRTTNEIVIDRAAWLEYAEGLTDGSNSEPDVDSTETDDGALAPEAGTALERSENATRTSTDRGGL
ncbi:hypothetical protein [Saliphagus infecundisoli]|uniref:DUF222 domain-containing protein n=1 Tax=Saliphagus infecundisoli TaxID=1849069 RepID=A0ABD5QIU0_9EURY|nr:hypothetical protein [Saliphagus infecundisoli]